MPTTPSTTVISSRLRTVSGEAGMAAIDAIINGATPGEAFAQAEAADARARRAARATPGTPVYLAFNKAMVDGLRRQGQHMASAITRPASRIV